MKAVAPLIGRKKNKIPPRIGNSAAAQSDGIQIFVEPNAVVKHGAKKGLLRSLFRIAKATYPLPLSHPASTVSENAALSAKFAGLS